MKKIGLAVHEFIDTVWSPQPGNIKMISKEFYENEPEEGEDQNEIIQEAVQGLEATYGDAADLLNDLVQEKRYCAQEIEESDPIHTDLVGEISEVAIYALALRALTLDMQELAASGRFESELYLPLPASLSQDHAGRHATDLVFIRARGGDTVNMQVKTKLLQETEGRYDDTILLLGLNTLMDGSNYPPEYHPLIHALRNETQGRADTDDVNLLQQTTSVLKERLTMHLIKGNSRVNTTPRFMPPEYEE
jgi:hypothetical protein